mgnify:CR=1 FL=1
MDTAFLKKPTFIATAVIALAFFLSFITVESPQMSVSASGFQLLTNGASLSSDKGDIPENIRTITVAGMYSGVSGIGIIDKVSVLLFIASGLLMFGAFKESKNEAFFLDADKIKYIKYGMIGICVLLVVRYAGGIGILGEPSAGIGLWISLLASIFLGFEHQIMEKVNSSMNKPAAEPTTPVE